MQMNQIFLTGFSRLEAKLVSYCWKFFDQDNGKIWIECFKNFRYTEVWNVKPSFC